MATWQFDLYLVPRAVGAFREDAWSKVQPASGWDTMLQERLPRGSSWHEMLSVWGSDDSNRIDVWRERERVRSIFVRVDARKDAEEVVGFCEWLATFARACGDTHLAAINGLVVPPSGHELGAALRGSAAWRFVDDPAAFLRRLEVGGVEDT